MTWTEDSANLRRDLSFLATMEMGSKVGSFRSASEEDSNKGDENSSETLEVLDDLSIFCFALDSNAETGRQRPRESRGICLDFGGCASVFISFWSNSATPEKENIKPVSFWLSARKVFSPV